MIHQSQVELILTIEETDFTFHYISGRVWPPVAIALSLSIAAVQIKFRLKTTSKAVDGIRMLLSLVLFVC